MKKTGIYPDWVDQYRGNGRSVKKTKNGYSLYACTSVYVKGGKPKSVQTYLGRITEKDGFIPKSVPYEQTIYIEFSLSRFIWLNYRRDLKRSVHAPSEDLVLLGIIHFVFGGVSLHMLESSAMTRDRASELFEYYKKISPKRVESISSRIASLLEDAFPDEADRLSVVNGLKLSVIPAGKPVPQTWTVPEKTAEIIQKRGLLYGC